MDYQKKMTKFLAKHYLQANLCAVREAETACDQCLQFLRAHQGAHKPLYPQLQPKKLVPWNEAMESRPPLQPDMDGPGPNSYLPTIGTSAPAFSFGRKSPDREGGGRTSWQKSWFQSSTPFTKKTNFECLWPSPFAYPQISTLGPNQPSRKCSPCFSIGRPWNPPPVNQDPSPNTYDKALASEKVRQTPPAYSLHSRMRGTQLWPNRDPTPGPGYYNVEKGFSAVRPQAQSFVIRGERGNKRHDLGPFSTL